MAEVVDVGVVGVGSGGAQDEEVAVVSVVTEPAKGFIEVLASAHKRVAGVGMDAEVGGRSDAKVAIGGCGGRRGRRGLRKPSLRG